MDAVPQAVERRAAPRAPWYGQALLHIQQRRLGCTVVDISTSGLLVVPPARAPKGAALLIELTLPPQAAPVQLAAVVAREGDVHGHYAWGLRFLDPSPDVQQAIGAFVSSTRRRLGAERAAQGGGVPPADRAPISAPYSQVRTPRFRSDPAARAPAPSGTGLAATSRSSSSGTYHKVYGTPAPAASAPSPRSSSSNPGSSPQLAGMSTTASAARPAPTRAVGETTPHLGVRVARRSSSTAAAAPARPRDPRLEAPLDPRPAPHPAAKPPGAGRGSSAPAQAKRATGRATQDWDERAHCTPIEVRELYQEALSELNGRRGPHKR